MSPLPGAPLQPVTHSSNQVSALTKDFVYLLQHVLVPPSCTEQTSKLYSMSLKALPHWARPTFNILRHIPVVQPLLLLLASDQSPLRRAVSLGWGPGSMEEDTHPAWQPSLTPGVAHCLPGQQGLLSGSSLCREHPPFHQAQPHCHILQGALVVPIAPAPVPPLPFLLTRAL